MTKHAMEAYADALADEMKHFNVRVSLIEPGAYKSKIGRSAIDRMEERNQSTDDSKLKSQMDESVNWLSAFEEDAGDPVEVADAVMKALFDEDPKPRYLVTPNQAQTNSTINTAIQRMVEQNSDHKFSLSRDELIEMLDTAMAKQEGTRTP